MADRRPQPKLFAPSASAEEAAAIVAALELFMRATAVKPRSSQQERDGWRRAAIFEGVSREPQHDLYDPWINT